ncbi:serine/threonine-protein kinase GA29083 [Diachasma alloeum]|uniref:serine/threonine-protein kinase GA29083 n=1 Tax=Diachasma alloeum TaxID=454923 RepID=UPI00073834D8|nr:serine/threonine-protein kinase GA29083 [Diachasma alloeum]
MEEPLSRRTSTSGDSNLSSRDINSPTVTSLDDRLLDIASKASLSSLRTPPTKKAKRVRFFRNGDKFYTGVVMAVTPERYRSFDSLATDLTRALVSSVTLPSGVRCIYSMDGRKVQSITDLEDGKCYVVSGQGELFKKVDYSSSKVRRGSSLSGLPQSPAGTGRQINAIPSCVKARIITLIRHGTKPRRVLRLLLNKRNAASLEHVLEAITEVVKLDCGAVRRVYTLSGKLVITLDQFFESEEVFVAYGTEKSTQEDFELDPEESKSVQSFRRGPSVSKRQGGPMPVMPRKTGKRNFSAPQVRTPSPASLMLPQPLRMHYSVGHVIGDGNFAVVRHCVHKQSGAEYAMKIVDKHKCQGKETMLASEVAILRQVCHPNIISLIGEQETSDQLFLVMELVKGGDLFDAIAAVTKFTEAEASVMIGHLTSALAYLHSHYIVHRDVKPENLLVEMEGSHVRCLKLGDFGLAQVVREPLYTVCGTPTYVAPEILAETGYGLKIDVWAAGVILYILLCGFPPFVSLDNDQEELFERILSGQYEFTPPYWDPISDSAKQLISNMLQAQPELRFSAEDVLDHPWLVSFLGGEQAPGRGKSSLESSEQHWDKQCKPMRVATFEFDYKKQRSSKNDETPEINTTPKSRWFDATFTTPSTPKRATDETDHINGNGNDEPISLSSDCLQDIRALTSSLHNLMDNMNITNDMCNKSSTIVTSINSIPETNSAMKNNNGQCQSDKSSNLHSNNQRNGNSLSDIHSSISTTPVRRNYRGNDTLKPVKCNIRGRAQRRDLYDTNGATKNIKSTLRQSSIDRLSLSTDCLSAGSDNNIETSDSFVNIQFGNVGREQHFSSNQSLEFLESFENAGFDRGIRIPQSGESKIPKTPRSNVSQLTRLSQIPVQINGQNYSRGLERNEKKPGTNESVKLREKKSGGNSEKVRKRFSYAPQYSKRLQELDNGRMNRTVPNGRKCSSTDELREDEQKPVKNNRYSLYYTPQLARKTYEMDNGGKSPVKTSRPISWKSSEYREEGESSLSKNRNRKSVDGTTVASRSRNSRQSIHVKAGVGGNLPIGRSK